MRQNWIIVLGCAVSADGKPGGYLRYRLDLAAGLYQKNEALIIVTGGKVHSQNFSEAEVMKNYLHLEYQVPIEDILCEPLAVDTFDNVVKIKELAAKHGWSLQDKNISIITSDFHIPRTRKIFEAVFPEIVFQYHPAEIPATIEQKRRLERNEQILIKYWLPGKIRKLSR